MNVRHILSISLTVLVLVGFLLLLPLLRVKAATAPSMGDAASFAVLAGSTVTNTGNSVITGDVGLSPGTSITGFPPGIVVPPGTIHAADTQAGNAQIAATAAYIALANQLPTNSSGTADLAGLTLSPGVYRYSSSVLLSGVLILNGGPTDVWVFQIGSALTTEPGSSVEGTGLSCNIFWQVTSSATLDTTTSFKGQILALQSISLKNGASVRGRLLALNGAVTLINNNINDSLCAGFTPGGVGVSKIFSPSTIITPGGVSTLTITLTNTNAGNATLTSPFIDTLPSGLVIANPSNVATTAGGSLAPTANPGGSNVTLPAGDWIPGGNASNPGVATLTVDVTSQFVGAYVNTLGGGALRTNMGNNTFLIVNAQASATLVVSLAVGGYDVAPNILAVFLGFAGPWIVAAAASAAVIAVAVKKTRRK